jgi:hypothetical protein
MILFQDHFKGPADSHAPATKGEKPLDDEGKSPTEETWGAWKAGKEFKGTDDPLYEYLASLRAKKEAARFET